MMVNEHNYDDIVERHIQQELTSRDKEYAAVHLNETDETRETAIVDIRRWIEDELHIQIDDFLILRFLRVCKFNLEKTKTRIQNYYKLRSVASEWFQNKDPFRSELQEVLDLGIFLPLRKLDNKGRLVIITRPTRNNPRIHKLSDIIKISVILLELAMKDRVTAASASLYGCILINDSIKPTIHHTFQFNPSVLKKIAHTWQNCYPIRIQLIYVVNAPALVEFGFRILRSFMTEKMSNRFCINRYMLPNSFFEDVPADIMPVEYGGTNGTIQELTEYWKKLVEENREWVIRDESE